MQNGQFGSVCLLTCKGCILVLHDVLNVSDIRFNLISTEWMDDEG